MEYGFLRNLGIPVLLMLTKVDEEEAILKDQIEKIYTLPKIIDLCKRGADNCGIAHRDALPVKCFNSEVMPDFRAKIPFLVLLRHIQNAAKDVFRVSVQGGSRRLTRPVTSGIVSASHGTFDLVHTCAGLDQG